MKKTSKCLGIIAIAMAILLTFAACNKPTGGGHTHTEGICTICGVVRITDAPIKFVEEPSPGYNFAHIQVPGNSHPLSDLISGAPKVEINGTGASRTITIELDASKPGASAIALSTVIPGVTASGGANCYFIISFISDDEYLVLLGKDDGWYNNAFFLYADKDTDLTSTIYSFDNMAVKKGWNYVFKDSGIHTHAAQSLPAEYYWKVLEND